MINNGKTEIKKKSENLSFQNKLYYMILSLYMREASLYVLILLITFLFQIILLLRLFFFI